MNTLDSTWLLKQIARVVEAPTSAHTVLTSDVNEEAIKGYIKEVQLHLSASHKLKQESAPDGVFHRTE